MVALNEANEFTQHATEKVSEAIEEAEEAVSRHPYRTGGIVLLVLGLLGLYYMWPEIQREIKMLRM